MLRELTNVPPPEAPKPANTTPKKSKLEGVTIEIAADTQGLDAALEKANRLVELLREAQQINSSLMIEENKFKLIDRLFNEGKITLNELRVLLELHPLSDDVANTALVNGN